MRFVVGLLTAVVLLAGIAGAVTLYLYGALRLSGPGARTTVAARVQLAATAAVLVGLQAVSYWLDRYSTLTNVHTRFAVRATPTWRWWCPPAASSPSRRSSARCCSSSPRSAAAGASRPPVWACSWCRRGGRRHRARGGPARAGGANEARGEAPYIQDNIEATRAAFGIAGTDVTQYDPAQTAAPGALSADAGTTASIRILDPAVVSPTFGQNQQVRNFYQFASPLDVDRYSLDGNDQDVVVALRELTSTTSATVVGEHPHPVHPRVRPGGRGRQPAGGQRPAPVPRGRHPQHRLPAGLRAADLLRGEQP